MKRLLLSSATLFLFLLFQVSSRTVLVAQTQGGGATQVSLQPGFLSGPSGSLFKATVVPVLANPLAGTPIPHPTGSITFLDGTTVLNAGGTPLAADPEISSRTFAQVFGNPDPGIAAVAQGEVMGDFDGDGKADLIVYGSNGPNSLELQTFVSSSAGGGTIFTLGPVRFRALAVQTLALPGNATPAVLDVDGDGKLDLLVGNTVAYGIGDGTFARVAVLPALATGFNQTYAVDINGDGKLDIVAVNTPPDPRTAMGTVQYTFTVFRNDGSGTFTSLGSFPLAAPFQAGSGLCCVLFNIFGLSFADLNGDGKLDVISQSNSVPLGNAAEANNLSTILNNGDGTFGAPRLVANNNTNSLGYIGSAFADMNGDGKTDMVLAYSPNIGGNYLAVYAGQGDGTFANANILLLDKTLAPAATMQSVVLTDINADGHPDAITSTGSVALGDGQGSLSLSTPLFPEVINSNGFVLGYPLLQGDFLTGPLPSLVLLNLTSGANAVFTPVVSSSAGLTPKLSPGMHTLTAQYSGDGNYAAATSNVLRISILAPPSMLTLTSSANPAYVGQNVTFTATVGDVLFPATGSVVFSNGSTSLATVPISNGSATYTTSFPAVGNATITAAYGGDSSHPVSSATVSEAVIAAVTVGGGGTPPNLTVASGQSTTTQISVTGAAGFSGTVSFTCTGLPVNASCSFSPASVSVAGATAVTTTLTIATTAATVASAVDSSPVPAGIVVACGLPLLGFFALVPVYRGRRTLMLGICALILSGAVVLGCGGSSKPAQPSQAKTPAGSYSFNVVATSGTSQSMASYILTVQ